MGTKLIVSVSDPLHSDVDPLPGIVDPDPTKYDFFSVKGIILITMFLL